METTTNEVVQTTKAERRSAQLQGLYELIHWLVDHEDVTIPHWLTVQHLVIVDTLDEAKAVRRQLGACEKTASDSFVGFSHDFGGGIEVAAVVLRESVCERVQTGTRHVETVEAHDEPVYEYKCPESLLDPEPTPRRSAVDEWATENGQTLDPDVAHKVRAGE